MHRRLAKHANLHATLNLPPTFDPPLFVRLDTAENLHKFSNDNDDIGVRISSPRKSHIQTRIEGNVKYMLKSPWNAMHSCMLRNYSWVWITRPCRSSTNKGRTDSLSMTSSARSIKL